MFDVLCALLQHCGLAQLGVWILLQLRNKRMQHVEAVLDVVAPLLFRMDVARPSLAVGSAMLVLLVEFIANSARTRTSFT